MHHVLLRHHRYRKARFGNNDLVTIPCIELMVPYIQSWKMTFHKCWNFKFKMIKPWFEFLSHALKFFDRFGFQTHFSPTATKHAEYHCLTKFLGLIWGMIYAQLTLLWIQVIFPPLSIDGLGIVGGTPADPYPFFVKVKRDRYSCGGTIASENTVLTAAHCLYHRGDDPRSGCRIIVFETFIVFRPYP